MRWKVQITRRHDMGLGKEYIAQADIEDSQDRRIASVNIRPHTDGKVESIANLMAASPELLEAIQNLQKELRGALNFNVRKHYSLMVADAAATKVVARATGGSQ